MVTAHSLVLAAVSTQLAELLSADAADAEGGEDEAEVADVDGGDSDGGGGVDGGSDVNDDANVCHDFGDNCGVACCKHFVNCSSAQWHSKKCFQICDRDVLLCF